MDVFLGKIPLFRDEYFILAKSNSLFVLDWAIKHKGLPTI